jgi:hypothetical protein
MKLYGQTLCGAGLLPTPIPSTTANFFLILDIKVF